jgi:hypothetical protein
LLFAAIVAVLLSIAGIAAQAAARPQLLTIALLRDHAATEGFSHYRLSEPIDVRIESAGAPAAVHLTAAAPDGTAIGVPLHRMGNAFTGSVRLSVPGTWSLALSTRYGAVSTALAAIPLDVVGVDGPENAGRIGFALAALQLTAGITIFARRRGASAARKRS